MTIISYRQYFGIWTEPSICMFFPIQQEKIEEKENLKYKMKEVVGMKIG